MTQTVAVVGTFGTRKTTAIEYLAAAAATAGRQVAIVPAVARTSPLATNEASTARTQLWVATTRIARELEAAQKAPLLLTDGALVNDYVYLLRASEREQPNKYDPFDLRGLVATWTADTTAFLFLRPDILAVADGVRSTSEGFRYDIDQRLEALLDALAGRSRVFALPASSVEPDLDWDHLLAVLVPVDLSLATVVPAIEKPDDLGSILFVDDDPALRALSVIMLRRGGYAVREAAGVNEALDILSDPAAQFALVITDIVMPGRDGGALITRLRTLRKGTPFLAISSFSPITGSELSFEELGIEGSTPFLAKPYKAPALLAAVKAAIEGPRSKQARSAQGNWASTADMSQDI